MPCGAERSGGAGRAGRAGPAAGADAVALSFALSDRRTPSDERSNFHRGENQPARHGGAAKNHTVSKEQRMKRNSLIGAALAALLGFVGTAAAQNLAPANPVLPASPICGEGNWNAAQEGRGFLESDRCFP